MRIALFACLLVTSCARGPSIFARDPAEVHQATKAMAEARSTKASDIARLVELLDHTEQQMSRDCQRYFEPLAPEDGLAAGYVNSLGQNQARCRAQPWPTTAGFARRALLAWPDQRAVADAIVARAFAKVNATLQTPPYFRLDNLFGIGGAALARRVTALLPTVDARHRDVLMALALEVDGGDPEALHGVPGTRAAAIQLRWGATGATRATAIATLTERLDDASVLRDLVRVGPAAAPILTRANRERIWRLASKDRMSMGVVVELVDGANVAVGPDERRVMAKIYDRHCEEPDRRTEREMGEWFTMWSVPPEECGRVHAWLGM